MLVFRANPEAWRSAISALEAAAGSQRTKIIKVMKAITIALAKTCKLDRRVRAFPYRLAFECQAEEIAAAPNQTATPNRSEIVE